MGSRGDNSAMKSEEAKDIEAAPSGRATASWADETLPLGLRKELLDRELQKLIAAKAPKADRQSADSPTGLTRRKADGPNRDRDR
jgi:hypothetical protein